MSVKDIILKPINSRIANDFIKKYHYSGKVVNNSQLHFGVYYNNILGGVMSYGPSTDKSKLIGLVEGTKRNEFIELNRMAFCPLLPKNSESRAIAISIRLLKKYAPQIKWIVSFADGCQCGDGTIYRASGFDLTQIKKNGGHSIVKIRDTGEITHSLNFKVKSGKFVNEMKKKGYSNWKSFLNNEYGGYDPLDGYMLRYIKPIKQNLKRNYEVLDYKEIDKIGAGMYKGQKRCSI